MVWAMILKYKASVPPNMTGCLKYVNPIIVGLIGPNSPELQNSCCLKKCQQKWVDRKILTAI